MQDVCAKIFNLGYTFYIEHIKKNGKILRSFERPYCFNRSSCAVTIDAFCSPITYWALTFFFSVSGAKAITTFS